MKIKIWGARGSIPSPLKPEAIEEKIFKAIFGMPQIETNDADAVWAHIRELHPLLRGTAGGNTSCVEIQAAGQTFIIDAGSGLRELGLELLKGPCGRGKGKLYFFFSHAHWDHIQGFPFFIPAFIPGNRIFIHSIHDIEQALRRQQEAISFPVPLSRAQATIEFIRLQADQSFHVGQVRIDALKNNHPGDSYSYRFKDQHSVFVFASDSEYKRLDDPAVTQPHLEFFKEADALIFDAQYTLKDVWQSKEDWGHSSALIGVDLARTAGVKKLILFHHDPTYSDTQLQEIQVEAIVYQAQDITRPTCEVLVAYEGLTLDLTPPGAVGLRLTPDGEAAILTPTHIFDERGMDQLTQRLARLAEQGFSSNSIIDLSQVETLTTASLRLLAALYKLGEGHPIVLAGPSENVLRVIRVGGYLDFFAIYPSVEAAFSALQARKALNLPGQVIKERYQIENKLAEGRLGTVLKATDIQLKRPVALIVLSPLFSHETLDRFMKQASQLVNLDHPNIVKVVEVGYDGEHAFVVEEFVEGATLLDDFVTHSKGLIPNNQALEIALHITLSLEYAHSQGIIHGNLRPQNIFLTAEGVKLGDFGLGRLIEGHNLLNAPWLHMTPSHLAPEQILGHPVDARTDLYALGVIFYQLFTGQPPFTGSDREVMQAHLQQNPRPPRELYPQLSPFLEHLILKLMAKSPNDRYTSVEQAYRIYSSLLINLGKAQYPHRKPLIGREKQLQLLQTSWAEVQAGRGQLVLISGEPGIGKTSLASHAAAQFIPPVLLIGHCQEREGSAAYHPFTEILQSYFATVPPELLDQETHQFLPNFAHLVPELRQILPDLPEPPPLEPKQEQLRLISNLTQFIKQATQKRPWLLLLDDLQWADQGSLEVLRYLSHHLPSMPLLIMGGYRDTELQPGHPLLELLRDLSGQAIYHHLPLERLAEADLGQILTNIWQQPAPAALVERIYQRTEGNPFYVEEVAKGLIDENLISWQDGVFYFPALEQIQLPKSVRDAVWRRIDQLSPQTLLLLRQAAVLGQAFKFDELQAMSGLTEWEVLEHLDIALARQLIQEIPGEAQLGFSHAEIRQVIYTDMGMLRRRLLHHQAGEALERQAMPEPERIAEKLAYHFGEAGEFERALVYSIHAARRAELAWANEAALLWYGQTLTLLAELDAATAANFQPMEISTHQRMGQVLTLMGQYEEALRHYTAAQASLESGLLSGSHLRQLANLYGQLAEVYRKRSEYDEALAWVEKGLELLHETEPSPEMARLYLMGAWVFDQQGKLDQAITWCQKSLAIASPIKTLEAQQIMAQVYTRLSSICLIRGSFDLVVHFCHESIETCQQLNDLAGQAHAYNNLGLAYFNLGNWAEAGRAFDQSLAISQQLGSLDGQAAATDNLALIHLARGEWDRALSLLEQNQAIWRQIGSAKDEAWGLSYLARIHLCRENWAEAQACLERSQAIYTRIGASDYLPELECCWAEFYLKTNALEPALAHIQRSLALALEQDNLLDEGKSRRLLGQIHLALHELTPAEAALHRSLQILTDLGSQYEVAKTELALARLALETGSKDQARNYLDQAWPILAKLEAKIDLLEVEALEIIFAGEKSH